MEGATESGKNVANLILKKYNLDPIYKHSHMDPSFVKWIQDIDDILYEYKLPNIIDLIVFSIICIVIFVIKKIDK